MHRLAMNTTERYCRLVREGQTPTLFLLGTWQLAHFGPIDAALAAEDLPASRVTLDGAALGTLDTAATLALLRRVVDGVGKTGSTLGICAPTTDP